MDTAMVIKDKVALGPLEAQQLRVYSASALQKAWYPEKRNSVQTRSLKQQ